MNPGETEPVSLVERMRAGCDRSFTTLIEPQALPLRVLIRQIAGAAARADFDEDDMFQLVIFRAWQLRESFVDLGPGSFQRWLVALARNIIGDRLRYLGGKGRDESRRHLDAASIASAIPDSITSIASRSARSEEAAQLAKALDELEPSEREVVQLHYLEGLSLAEISTRTGRPKATLWKELRRVLQRLRTSLPD